MVKKAGARPSTPPRALRRLAVAGGIFAAGVVVGYLLGHRPAPPPLTELRGGDARPPVGAAPEPPPPRAAPPPSPTLAPPPPDGARLALVIDDLGRSREELEPLRRLGIPITFAVLPFAPRAGEVASELTARGAEVLCHLPMEPASGEDPGPGALTSRMSRRQLRRATREALARVPGAVGVNNHMGSRLTTDPRAMATVLGVLADEGLYFLDSRTSPRSVAFATARSLGVAAGERDVFLDVDAAPAEVRARFRELLATARERGRAIAIGHPKPETVAVLAEEVPRAIAAGYRFVPLSALLRDS